MTIADRIRQGRSVKVVTQDDVPTVVAIIPRVVPSGVAVAMSSVVVMPVIGPVMVTIAVVTMAMPAMAVTTATVTVAVAMSASVPIPVSVTLFSVGVTAVLAGGMPATADLLKVAGARRV